VSPTLPAARFPALGSSAVVLTTDAAALDDAVARVTEQIAAIDQACSRFRDDSELSALNRAAGRALVVSPLLLRAIQVARRAASQTDGLVDPTVGATLVALGYDRDFRSVPPTGPELRGSISRPVPWRRIEVDAERSQVRLPKGTSLDLGATAKALAVDLAVEAAAKDRDNGVLVSIGGDLAVAGSPPDGGWPVLVTDDHARDDDPDGQTIKLIGGALATSGTTVRQWTRGERPLHHVIDPRTGEPAQVHWRTVSVAAATCVDANIAATAAIVLGLFAPAWLEERGLPARLVSPSGTVVHVAGWPTHDETLG
jgi:thiamine biosynthesis lipoprotein